MSLETFHFHVMILLHVFFLPFLKELQNCNCNCNLNQRFKLLFFKISLDFGTSDYISTYGKLNLLPINSIFLVFPSRERQRTLMQTKVYYKLSLFSLKRSVSQTFKSSSCKKSLFQACLLLIQLASMNYFRSMR